MDIHQTKLNKKQSPMKIKRLNHTLRDIKVLIFQKIKKKKKKIENNEEIHF